MIFSSRRKRLPIRGTVASLPRSIAAEKPEPTGSPHGESAHFPEIFRLKAMLGEMLFREKLADVRAPATQAIFIRSPGVAKTMTAPACRGTEPFAVHGPPR